MRSLIINADGFGFTYGNNRGILDTIESGIVRSVSVSPNFEASKEAVELNQKHPKVSIGIHYNLAVGKPILEPRRVPSLVNEKGEFLDCQFARAAVMGKLKLHEMRLELEAQTESLQSGGVRLTHFDGHRNQHLFPGYFDVALNTAKRFGIERMRTNRHYLFSTRRGNVGKAIYYAQHPTRAMRHVGTSMQMYRARHAGFRMADRMISPIREGDGTWKTDREMWIALFETLPRGTSEIYCHPGYVDNTLTSYAVYTQEREQERRILSDKSLTEVAESCGVKLISFWDI